MDPVTTTTAAASMNPWALAAIMMGAGIAKSEMLDRPREQRQRKLAGITAQYSPWTGMTPDMPKETDTFGAGMQAGTTGYMLGQTAQANAQNQGLIDAQKDYYNSMALQNKNAMAAQLPSGGTGAAGALGAVKSKVIPAPINPGYQYAQSPGQQGQGQDYISQLMGPSNYVQPYNYNQNYLWAR